MTRNQKAVISCRHCGVEYLGTEAQLRRLKEEGRGGYCSTICKQAAIESRKARPRTYGPCPTCGEMFSSKREKAYCSMKCWTSSEAFVKAGKEGSKKALDVQGLQSGKMVPCIECGGEVYAKPSQKRRYCSSECYRTYQARRFDRWIASPEGIAIEQAYDEFLTQEELQCPIQGCGWHGQSLSHHMNFAHGVPHQEFKRAAGFNLTTGVIASPLRETFCAREGYGSAAIAAFGGQRRGKTVGYSSKEGSEHRRKAVALVQASRPAKSATCPQCAGEFAKPALGHKTYCSISCRTAASIKRRREKRDDVAHNGHRT